MSYKYIHILPIVEGVWYPILFSITYVISVINKDIPVVFPYVSDTGARSIERCIFSFGMAIGSLLMISVMYIRHLQVRDLLKQYKYDEILLTLSKVALFSDVCASMGVLGIACFPVWPYFYLHTAIGIFTFSFGSLILQTETYISYKLYPRIGSKNLNRFRLALTILLPVSMIIVGVSGITSLKLFNGDDKTQWTESFEGYVPHLISTSTEWVVIFTVILYISLYAYEFRTISVYKPKVDTLEAV